MTSILVLGPPRSGSTWVARTLALADGAQYVHEPDNEKTSLLGWALKWHLPRFPRLRVTDRDDAYLDLFRCAFRSGAAPLLARNAVVRRILRPERVEELIAAKDDPDFRADVLPALPRGARAVRTFARMRWPVSRLRVVKSVHGVLSSDWLAFHFGDTRVVVTLRSPHGIIASMRRLGMPDAIRRAAAASGLQKEVFGRVIIPEPEKSDAIERMALQLAIAYRFLEQSAAQHGWPVMDHEDVCLDPPTRFQGLFARLQLPWSSRVADGLAASNAPGERFNARRVASAEIGKWRKDLSATEVRAISDVFERCGMPRWATARGEAQNS